MLSRPEAATRLANKKPVKRHHFPKFYWRLVLFWATQKRLGGQRLLPVPSCPTNVSDESWLVPTRFGSVLSHFELF
jgi:hypothetical protein